MRFNHDWPTWFYKRALKKLLSKTTIIYWQSGCDCSKIFAEITQPKHVWTKVNTVVANQYILTAAYPLLNMLFLYVRAHPYLLMALTTLRHFDSYVVVMQPIVPLLPLNLFEVLVVQDSHPAHSLLNNTSWYFHSRKVYFCLKVKTHIRPVQCSAVFPKHYPPFEIWPIWANSSWAGSFFCLPYCFGLCSL